MKLWSRLREWLADWLAAWREAPEEEEEEFREEERAAVIPARTVRPLEFVLFTPGSYDDARHAVKKIKEGKVVVLLLGEMDAADAQRILDFVSGAVYLLGASMQLFAGNVVICAPEAVRIEKDDYDFSAGIPVFRGLDS